jgi:hypothetical protein
VVQELGYIIVYLMRTVSLLQLQAYRITTATNATFSLVHKWEHEPDEGDFRVRSFKAKMKP